MSDLLIFLGDEIKAGDGGKVAGYLVRYGSPSTPDITGDYFTPDTDFGFDKDAQVGVYFHHGLPVNTAKGAVAYRERIGSAKLTRDEFGVYAEAVLSKRNEYEALYTELVEQGKAGWSSGAASHLVDRVPEGKANRIERWVIAEASITHIPAEPRNAVFSIKALTPPDPEGVSDDTAKGDTSSSGDNMDSVIEFIEGLTDEEFVDFMIFAGATREDLEELGVELVDDAAKHGSHDQRRHGWRYATNNEKKVKGKGQRNEYLRRYFAYRNSKNPRSKDPNLDLLVKDYRRKQRAGKSIDFLGEQDMDNEVLTGLQARIDALEATIKSAPAVPQTVAAPAQPKSVKSVEDLAAALFQRNDERLAEYGVKSTKDLSGQAGSQGGYLIPSRTIAEVFQLTAAEGEIVKPRSQQYSFGGAREMYIPAVRQTTAVANSSAFYGGVAFSYVNEGGTKPETEPVFEQIKLTAHKLAGFTYASDEVLADTANLENALRRMYQGALTHRRDFDYLQGDGAGKPLGVLNSAALVTVTRTTGSTIKYADIVNMWARWMAISPANGVWIVSQPASAKLMFLEDATGAPVYMPTAERSLRAGQLPPLLGLPVIISEKAKPLGTTGDIMLCDFSAYATADSGGIEIAMSRDYKFINDITTFRLVYRHDGQPLLKAAVPTMAAGSNTTVSPFVVLS